MRSVTALIALLLAAVLAVPAAAQDKPRSGGELVFPVPSEPPTYDGHREETFGLIHPFAPFYNTMIRVDPNDPSGTKPAPSLAESWTVSSDGRTYTFKLHHGVKFHDGSEMTSKDVKASHDKIINPPAGVASDRKGQYQNVEAVEAPDPADLDERTERLVSRIAAMPVNQLMMVKLALNSVLINQGVANSSMVGTVFDGIARHTPEGHEFTADAMEHGFRDAVRHRDEPFGDYGRQSSGV